MHIVKPCGNQGIELLSICNSVYVSQVSCCCLWKSMLNGVTALVPWLISSLHPPSFLRTLWSHTHTAVNCIPECYRQNQDSNPTLHTCLSHFPLSI